MKLRFSTRLSPITVKQIKELSEKLDVAQSEIVQRAVDNYSKEIKNEND